MKLHPSELTIRDFEHMNRDELLEILKTYAAYSAGQLRRNYVERLEIGSLRRLVISARRCYQARGY
jgi:hypothetical protein